MTVGNIENLCFPQLNQSFVYAVKRNKHYNLEQHSLG